LVKKQILFNGYIPGNIKLMTTNSNSISIESRVQLINTLAEAAELEHSLLCCYLYALFSMKNSINEDISEDELESVTKWKKVIRGIALEEMTHLTLVSNLMSAIGGSPYFMRPNLPSPAGPYPADLVIKLAPFDLETIKHFVYLERPADIEVNDGSDFYQAKYFREAPSGRLMPYGGDYDTVGDLYRNIRQSIERLSGKLGEENLFCGAASLQIGPVDSPLPGLIVINNLQTSQTALDTIVSQGEGAQLTDHNSHFCRFKLIEEEYEALLKGNPDFKPARPAARNPVMRRPPTPEGKVWCNAPLTAIHMDLANAVYMSSVRLLVQVYANPNRNQNSKRNLLSAAFELMLAMTPLGESLSFLPANAEVPGVNAGMSFAVVRTLSPIQDLVEGVILSERAIQIVSTFDQLAEASKNSLENKTDGVSKDSLDKLLEARQYLERAQKSIEKLKIPENNNLITKVTAEEPQMPENIPVQKQHIEGLPTGEKIEHAKGTNISISFDSNRCIHSRHCVTELPRVFKANTPGEWLYPDQADPEILAAVTRECPSGAIQYIRHDNAPNEAVPETNLVHVRENGPYAFLGELNINNDKQSFRATLCRCGQSAKKPYCDGSHVNAKFQATGEPLTLDTTALEKRNGPLEILPQKNGPLKVKGNLEICAGTGRSILKTTETKLCRCGNSKAKPLCDGSHAIVNFIADGE
jgi:CDGSH-type Zn-finger protein/uncharacterized Fe-S cluster protein YjdI